MAMWPEGVLVDRVRIAATGSDPIAARARADRALNLTEVRPAGLPGAAILCVRKVTDPRPRSVALHRDASPPHEWSRAVAGSIAEMARRAVSPVAGVIPADADAVLFADRSELLACLTKDWCQGRLRERWWWRALVRDGDHARLVVEAWLAAPTYVAAALAQLTQLGWGQAFVATLHQSDTTALMQTMLGAHGLAEPPVAARSPAHHRSPAERWSVAAVESTVTSVHRVAPWLPWAPETAAGSLRLDQKRLLGVALTVQRAPARVLTPAFIAAAFSWTPAATVTSTIGAVDPLNVAAQFVPVSPPRIIAARQPIDAGIGGEGDPVAPAPARYLEHGARGAPGVPAPEHASRRSAEPSLSAREHEATLSRGETIDCAPASSADEFVEPLRGTEPLESGLGGVFFLLNLGISLGLYGDFTTPAQPGIALPIWDFVTLLGRRLVSGGSRADPVWRLLARLSRRRTDDAPGAGFDAPRSRRLPAEWLRPFPERGTWRWSASSDRLRVRHPSGFLLLDVQRTLDEGAEQQARREIASYSDPDRIRLRPLPTSRTRTRTFAPLEEWTQWLLSYVRVRLAAAMPGVTPRAAGPLLCRQPARVFATPVHLHVVYSLDALPIEVRLSGLDRDPGWIPAAGRVVTFAFE